MRSDFVLVRSASNRSRGVFVAGSITMDVVGDDVEGLTAGTGL